MFIWGIYDGVRPAHLKLNWLLLWFLRHLGGKQPVPLYSFNTHARDEHICYSEDRIGLGTGVQCTTVTWTEEKVVWIVELLTLKSTLLSVAFWPIISWTDRESNTRFRFWPSTQYPVLIWTGTLVQNCDQCVLCLFARGCRSFFEGRSAFIQRVWRWSTCTLRGGGSRVMFRRVIPRKISTLSFSGDLIVRKSV